MTINKTYLILSTNVCITIIDVETVTDCHHYLKHAPLLTDFNQIGVLLTDFNQIGVLLTDFNQIGVLLTDFNHTNPIKISQKYTNLIKISQKYTRACVELLFYSRHDYK
jgi:ABC-type lipopolysaccharide export system ATPase subunit